MRRVRIAALSLLSVLVGGTMGDGAMDSNPPTDRVLVPGDQLVVLGTRSQLDALAALM